MCLTLISQVPWTGYDTRFALGFDHGRHSSLATQMELQHFLWILSCATYKIGLLPLKPSLATIIACARDIFKVADTNDVCTPCLVLDQPIALRFLTGMSVGAGRRG